MLAGVDRAFHAQGDGIALGLAAVDKGPQVEIAFRIDEMRHHRRAGDVFGVALERRVWADHLGEQRT